MSDASSSSSPTNPTHNSTTSIAELRISLQRCQFELLRLETRLSSGKPVGSCNALSVRLALISEILAAQASGTALVPPEQQLLELMLANAIERLVAATTRAAPPTSDGPELPLEPPTPSAEN